jgi:hypothetical protein
MGRLGSFLDLSSGSLQVSQQSSVLSLALL